MDKEWMERWKKVEDEFFDIDEENRLAHLTLRFSSPSEIFDANTVSKTPVMSDDFMDWIRFAMEYTPRRCRLDLHIEFETMEGYDEESLRTIFMKNVALEAKRNYREAKKKNLLAYGLIGLGVLSFIVMMLCQFLWAEGGVFRDVVFYVFDIATTVSFWEAFTILVVEKKERKDAFFALIKHFKSIRFSSKSPS